MGIKNFFKEVAKRIADSALGKTHSGKMNSIFKMVDINAFSNLIISCALPEIPKDKTYYLSAKEIERIKKIFNDYNGGLDDVDDTVLKPILSAQKKSNESMIKYFDKITDIISNIESTDYNKSKVLAFHEKYLGILTDMMNAMSGLKIKIISKASQNSIKNYVDGYVESVLNAKPKGIYWDEFLVWLVKIIDQNLEYLWKFKVELLKVKPNKGMKPSEKVKLSETESEKCFQVVSKTRKELYANYHNKKIEKTGAISGFFHSMSEKLSLGKAFKSISNYGKQKVKEKASTTFAGPEIKVMQELNSEKIKFLGFKTAEKIKAELEAYINTHEKNPRSAVYDSQKDVARNAVKRLGEYIQLKNNIKGIRSDIDKISTQPDNAWEQVAYVSKKLVGIKELMRTSIKNIMESLKLYKEEMTVSEITTCYATLLSRVDADVLNDFFNALVNKPVMFFEQYVSEVYKLCNKSINTLDEIIKTDDWKFDIDAEALGLNTIKFDLENLKLKTRKYSFGKTKEELEKEFNKICSKASSLKEEIKKERELFDKNVSTLNEYVKFIERNYRPMDEYFKCVQNSSEESKTITENFEKIDEIFIEFENKQDEFKKSLESENNKNLPKLLEGVSNSLPVYKLKSYESDLYKRVSDYCKNVDDFMKIWNPETRKNVKNSLEESQRKIESGFVDFYNKYTASGREIEYSREEIDNCSKLIMGKKDKNEIRSEIEKIRVEYNNIRKKYGKLQNLVDGFEEQKFEFQNNLNGYVMLTALESTVEENLEGMKKIVSDASASKSELRNFIVEGKSFCDLCKSKIVEWNLK